MKNKLYTLVPKPICQVWNTLVNEINQQYDMETTWSKGFGAWEIEYKYRRGGKTLCTFYAKEGTAQLLIVYGKAEREKFEQIMDTVSPTLQQIYENTGTLHDGKWLWIPIDETLAVGDVLTMLRIKRRPNQRL